MTENTHLEMSEAGSGGRAEAIAATNKHRKVPLLLQHAPAQHTTTSYVSRRTGW